MNNLNTNLPSGRNSKGESYPENENRYPEVTHMKQRRASTMVVRFRLSFYQQGIGHIPLESLCMFALVDYIPLNIPLGDADGVSLVCT